ncbi:MAG: 2-amino-4-hydroxy-6-hydroxymethyldihydropteridine diphosphokinase [Selenomonadaceae bacterium]|nr:2-amino-4-hydroxy-6-hydroxymethyldihydropteridine diphosphokinase [Selenomonadaceae bacterium]
MIYYLGLGGNLGEREKNIISATEEIKKIFGVKLLKISSFYETAAWGLENQPDFINAAVKISTDLEPLKLLDELQKIELELGRVRKEKWGARTIDIDIIFAEGFQINSERLTIPHKFLFERDFFLIPLSEIFPALKFNLNGDRVEKILGSPKDFKIKFVACVDKNFGLGYKNNLLFKIPADMKNFRELTLNHTIIYGRKTLQTFPDKKILDSRRNIILSRTLKNVEGAEVVESVEKLFEILRADEKNFVIGGEKIFSELLPYAEEIFLTVVDEEKISDVFFPKIDEEFILKDTKKFDGFEIRNYLRD